MLELPLLWAQLRWRRGVREQASSGCPSTRNSTLLDPALPAHFTWPQLAAPAYGPGWRPRRMIAHAVIAPRQPKRAPTGP